MDEDKKSGLRAQLDAHHEWPSEYMFKFIVPNQADRIGACRGLPDDVQAVRNPVAGASMSRSPSGR